jgi:hypothetical protein
MKNTIPKDLLTYIVGSDNPQLPDLIINLSIGENGMITGTGHIVSTGKNDDGFPTSQQLLVKGTYSIPAENEVIIALSGFTESGQEPVASIQLTLDGQWNGGTGSYHYVNAYLHHTQLKSKEETVYQMSYAAQQIDPNNH